MRRLLSFLLLVTPALGGGKAPKATYDLQIGDIVFQATGGRQCEVIRAATGSRWSHCGVVFSSGGRLHVLEAVSPVRSTPLEDFRRRSLPGTFHARRLARAGRVLDPEVLQKASRWAESQLGKPYDRKFLWGEDELYCSELVWKLFREAGSVELCKPRPFDSFDLRPAIVQQMIVDRFGSLEAFPAKEPVVAPHDLATSPLLVEVPRQAGKKH